MSDRKLATIERVLDVGVHPNADLLEIAQIKGWECVVKKGDFKKGDLIVFFEVDSWVPHSIAPFLCKNSSKPREYLGIQGERLRTIRLRGMLSQGLVMPINILESFKVEDNYVNNNCSFSADSLEEGFDLTKFLRIEKYEKPIKGNTPSVKGNFPSLVRKTDAERIQNIWPKMKNLTDEQGYPMRWAVEEKLDGSSTTVYWIDEETFGVASRNLDLKLDSEDNRFVQTVFDCGLLEGLKQLKKPCAVQGELCGPGIQGNKYNLPKNHLFIFDVWLVDEQRYALQWERAIILYKIVELGVTCLQVPFIGFMELPETNKEIIEMADGESQLAPVLREGLVFKSTQLVNGERVHFKCISNQFLLEMKE